MEVDQSAMGMAEEKPARFWRVGACSLIPWQWTDMHLSRYEGRGMGRRSLPVDVQSKSGLQMACNLDQNAMAAGRMEKPARFRRVGACSLIPWQSTDMQRLRRGMKA